MDEETTLPAFPQTDTRETGWRAGRAAIGAAASFIPVAGPVAAEIYESLVRNPTQERQAEWFNDLAARVAALGADAANRLDFAQLANDDRFITLMQEATERVGKTHLARKREALRNAVLNFALGERLDDALIGTFLSYIDRFSDAHLRILAFLDDPRADEAYVANAASVMMGSMHRSLLQAHPELGQPEGMIERIIQDLGREGLMQGNTLMTSMSGNGLMERQTTGIGRAFLAFIREPALD